MVVPSASALRWQLDNFGCDGDPFDYINITVLCNNTLSCTFGDNAELSGSLTASSDFTDSNITLKQCAGSICPDSYSKKFGTLCGWLKPTLDDQTCGEMGDYELSYEVKIPSEDSVLTGFRMSNLVTAKVEIGQDDECEGSVGTLLSSYQMESITLSKKIDGDNEAVPTATMCMLLTLFAMVTLTAVYATVDRRLKQKEELDGDERTTATRYAEF